MSYLDNLLGTHDQNLQRALDRTSERHGLLVGNLANVNTPGYKRRDLDFNITLSEEMGRLGSQGSGATPEISRGSVRVDGSSVDLESEVMSIAQTELRFQTLTELTSRYFSGLKYVIREGR